MSRRGDDEGFRPHPGDPWHPGWSFDSEAETTAPAAAEPVAPSEPSPAVSKRRRFGRGRRREQPGGVSPAGVGPGELLEGETEEDDGAPAPALPVDELAGWWGPGVTAGEAAGREASLPSVAESEEDGEEDSAAPLFPWWNAAAPTTPPAPAAPASADVPEAPPPPVSERRGADAASLIPLDLPAEPPYRQAAPEPGDRGLWEGPAVIPVIPPLPAEGIWPSEAEPAEEELPAELVEGAEAALSRGDEAAVVPVIPPLPAEGIWPSAVGPEGVEPGETEPAGVELLLGPAEAEAVGAEPSAASVAEELARATAALLAEIGEEPALVEPLGSVDEGVALEGVEELPWAAAGPGLLEEPALVEPPGSADEGVVLEGAGELPWAAAGPVLVDEPALVEPPGSVDEGVVLEGAGELPWAAAGPGLLEEPALVEPPGSVDEGVVLEGAEELPWAAAGPALVDEPALVEPPAAGEHLVAAEDLEPPAGEAGGATRLDDEGLEAGGGLVLPAWESPAAGIPAAGRRDEDLPAAAGPGALDLVPESEVDEWVAFVEGLPAGAVPAARRVADDAAIPEVPAAAQGPADEETRGEWPPVASRRRRWFRRKRDAREEGLPRAAAPQAEEAVPVPPPWAAGAVVGAEDGVVPMLDDAEEAEAAWAAWEAGAEGAAGQDMAARPAAALPEWEVPVAAGEAASVSPVAIPLAAAPGELPPPEADASFEEAEWAGEPEAAGAWFAEVDEDEVEVPPPGLPEEEWETEGEALWAVGSGEPHRPGGPAAPAGLPGPEPEPEEDLEAAGWEAFPEPGRPLAFRESGAAPAVAGPERAVAPAAPGAEPPEGWETFPEPGTRAPFRSGEAGRGPRPVPGPEPLFPEDEDLGDQDDAALWAAESEMEAGWPGAEPPRAFPAGEAPGGEEDEEAWAAEVGREGAFYEGPAPVASTDQRTVEIPAPVFDFEGSPRLQGPISEEVLAGAVTMEHRGLAEEMLAADTAETELQALSAPMPGLESGVVGFEDVAHLGSDEEMTAPMRSDLPIRVATGMVLALMLLGSLWVGGEFFAGFVGIMAVLGLGEFYGSLRRCGYQPLALFGFLGAAGILAGTWFYGPVAIPIATVAAVILSFFYYAFAPYRRDALTNGGLALLGMLWVVGTAAFAFPIAASADFRVLVLATAATVIATDVGAFFAGRSWGRRLMAPVLSPHKTWEGLAGGVVLGIGAAVGAGYLFDEIGVRAGAALGLVVAVMAPLGDLAESMVKRSLGVKDMGSILPGHGGILDRIDAFLFVLPAAWVLFETMGMLR